MKTPQQKKFEYLIIRMIEANVYVIERKGLLEDFKEDCDLCYELFCEQIYDFFAEKRLGNLWIDERGRLHVNPDKGITNHIYFELLSDVDYLEESEDVIDYINLALARLEEQVETVCRVVN